MTNQPSVRYTLDGHTLHLQPSRKPPLSPSSPRCLLVLLLLPFPSPSPVGGDQAWVSVRTHTASRPPALSLPLLGARSSTLGVPLAPSTLCSDRPPVCLSTWVGLSSLTLCPLWLCRPPCHTRTPHTCHAYTLPDVRLCHRAEGAGVPCGL